jgi:hypothetical protein
MSREAYGADIAGHLIFSSELVNKTVTNEDFLKTLYECLQGIETEEKYGYYISRLYDGTSRREIFREFVNTLAFEDYCDSHGVTAFSPVPSIFSDRFFVILCIVTLISVSSLMYLFSKMDEQELSEKQPK